MLLAKKVRNYVFGLSKINEKFEPDLYQKNVFLEHILEVYIGSKV